jgi:glycosyltransferase involved in cell wall biosynthesis
MKIAQIAPLTEAIPPKLYGGTERVVHWLTEELTAMGHDVTLFASGDSRTSSKLEAIWPKALRFDPAVRDTAALHMLMLERVCRRAHEFDVLHFHLDYHPFPLFAREPTPFISTLHGRLDLPELWPVYHAFPAAPIVSISDAQRRPLGALNWAATIYHGLPETLLMPLPSSAPGYLAFLGRIAPEKQVDAAIRIARRCGIPLKIAAKVDRADQAYFDERIRHLLDDPNVEFIGEIDDARKSAFLSGASALLLPIDWPEPFGIVMIEAMACGTPVIAFDRGSVPEVIDHGLTGFVVHDEDEAVGAVRELPSLSRAAIRQRFEERFTARRMASDYLDVYRRLIAQEVPRRRFAMVS